MLGRMHCSDIIRNNSLVHTSSMLSCIGYVRSRSSVISPQQLGFQFEKQVVQVLNNRYSFKIQNTSKQSHDQGVDFFGTLTVSELRNLSIPVLGQCKREWKPIGVHHIRELQGTLSQFNNQSFLSSPSPALDSQEIEKGELSIDSTTATTTTNGSYIGILISDSGYTTFATRLAQQCSDGIILCTLKDESLVNFIMNNAAKKRIGSQFITAFQRSSPNSFSDHSNRIIVFYEQGPNGEMIPLSRPSN